MSNNENEKNKTKPTEPRATTMDEITRRRAIAEREMTRQIPDLGLDLASRRYSQDLVNMNIAAESMTANKLSKQLVETSNSVKKIEEEIKNIKTEVSPELSNKLNALESEIQRLKDSANEAQKTSQELTAQVVLPPHEYMRIELVPRHLLERLGEYSTDTSLFIGFFGVFLGAILGIFTNVATGGSFQSSSWVILVILLIVSILAGGFAFLSYKRAFKAREKMLGTAIPKTETKVPPPANE